MQPEINSHFILSKPDDSNRAGKDTSTQTSTNSLFTNLLLLLLNSILPPTVTEASSVFQYNFITRLFLSRKDKEVKQRCCRLLPISYQCA